MKRMRLVFALVLLATHPAIPQQPQVASGPGLQETAKWIVNNLAHSGGKYDAGETPYEDTDVQISINECVLRYTVHRKMWVGAEGVNRHVAIWTDSVAIPLGTANALLNDTLSVPAIRLVVPTQSIVENVGNTNSSGSFMSGQHALSDWRIAFGQEGQDNTDLANRMVKALTHARDLCKTSYNPHPGEPF
jgi:hypothetical protein